MIGINKRESIKTAKIFIEATKPNSLKSLLEVSMNVAKPSAVVVLVKMVTLPIFRIILLNDFALLPCRLNSLWYLLIKKIQLGTPITINNGGIIADSMVILYWNKPSVPKDHITPIATTSIEIKTGL